LGGIEEIDQFSITEIKTMQMTKWNQKNAMEHCSEVPAITEDDLQDEYDYVVAEMLVKAMHESGLLPDRTYDEMRRKNLDIFSPLLARIT
jgi:hypothetical protein